MKNLLFLAIALSGFLTASAQKYMTRTGHISFSAPTAAEKIQADNTQAVSMIDPASGAIAFKVTMLGFQFEKALMQEHFNEDVESVKFPNATFEGKMKDYKAETFKNDGVYSVTVEGNLTVHGVAKPVSVPGKITVKGGKIVGSFAKFPVDIKSHGVKTRSGVPAAIEITVDITNYAAQ